MYISDENLLIISIWHVDLENLFLVLWIFIVHKTFCGQFLTKLETKSACVLCICDTIEYFPPMAFQLQVLRTWKFGNVIVQIRNLTRWKYDA